MDNFPLFFGLLCAGFFLFFTLAGGIALIVISQRNRKKGLESQNWPSVNGLVTVSEIKQGMDRDEDDHVTYHYSPKVEYTYEVGGQTYHAKTISFGGVVAYKNPNKVQPVLARYPLQGNVRVFYNPLKPQEAVLEQGAGKGVRLSLIFGIVLLALSCAIACPMTIGIIRNFMK